MLPDKVVLFCDSFAEIRSCVEPEVGCSQVMATTAVEVTARLVGSCSLKLAVV